MFKSWSYCQFKDGSMGTEFKHLSESNGKHIKIGEGKGKKEERNFIIEPFGSRINT